MRWVLRWKYLYKSGTERIENIQVSSSSSMKTQNLLRNHGVSDSSQLILTNLHECVANITLTVALTCVEKAASAIC